MGLGVQYSQRGGNVIDLWVLEMLWGPWWLPARALPGRKHLQTCTQALRKVLVLVLDVPGIEGSFLFLLEVMVSLSVLKEIKFWSCDL